MKKPAGTESATKNKQSLLSQIVWGLADTIVVIVSIVFVIMMFYIIVILFEFSLWIISAFSGVNEFASFSVILNLLTLKIIPVLNHVFYSLLFGGVAVLGLMMLFPKKYMQEHMEAL